MDLPWALLHRLALVVALVVAGLVVWAVDRPRGDWGARLRTRFVLGIPWGTLTVSALLLVVYLFVQGGWAHWRNPVVVAFRAWSYLYPLGTLTAAFAHVGPGHLLGNLFGTLVLAPLAEYWWGHFPRERGSSSFGSWRTNPLVRAFVVFPAAVVAVGLFTGLFTLGPVIGFSGVVFAFAGFALVRYPLGTVIAVVAHNVVDLVYRGLTSPWNVASGRPTFVTPWWADIAIQGHALGLLAGALLGIAYARRRGGVRPSALRVGAGVLLFGAQQALWAVYWFRGGTTFVLYRAVGTALVLTLAVLVALAVAASDRPLLPWVRTPADRETFLAAARGVSARQVGLVLLVVGAAGLAGPAVPVNLATTAGGDLPGEAVELRGYEVTYAENVRNGMVGIVDVEAFGETTRVNTSGVIVRNEDRHIWTTAVSKGRLAFAGRVRVTVGGVGWRETVVVRREGWSAVGGGTAYRISFVNVGRSDPVFLSKPARADAVVAGRNLSVVAREDGFAIMVAANDTSAVAPLPGKNESVTLRNVTFVREGNRVVAVHDGTRVTVFTKEQYRQANGR